MEGKSKTDVKCSYNSLSHYKGFDSRYKRLTYFILIFLTLAGWVTATCFIILWYQQYFSPDPAPIITPSNSGLSLYSSAAVAVDNGICSEIGRNTLESGGNAVDAAISSLICDGVMNPMSMGIGGGFFMVIYNSTTNRCTAIDSRETATFRAANHSNLEEFRRGWKSIATPGEIHGYWLAHQSFGRLPWKSLWQPSIKLLADGFYVPLALANALKHEWIHDRLLKESTMSIYVNPKTKDVYRFGDKIKDPVLARTMKILANSPDPVHEFYSGTLANTFVQEIKENGGFLDLRDLDQFKSRMYTGYETKLPNGLTYCSLGLPSAGPAVASYLHMLNYLQISGAKLNSTVADAARGTHNMIEALKLIYSLWVSFADSDDPKLKQLVSLMKTDSFGKHLASQVPNFSHKWDYYQGERASFVPVPEPRGDTAHISVMDQNNNAVSVTSSVNYFFGAMVRSPSTGIIWNNHMADFISRGGTHSSLNKIEPGKKPRSAMAPIIIYNSTSCIPRLVLGAAGGSRILGTVATVAARILYLNDTIKQAIDVPRFYISVGKNKIQIDEHMPQVLTESLRKMGHIIEPATFTSIAQAVSSDGQSIYANTDFRKPSYAAGF